MNSSRQTDTWPSPLRVARAERTLYIRAAGWPSAGCRRPSVWWPLPKTDQPVIRRTCSSPPLVCTSKARPTCPPPLHLPTATDGTSGFDSFHGHNKKAETILRALPVMKTVPENVPKQAEGHPEEVRCVASGPGWGGKHSYRGERLEIAQGCGRRRGWSPRHTAAARRGGPPPSNRSNHLPPSPT